MCNTNLTMKRTAMNLVFTLLVLILLNGCNERRPISSFQIPEEIEAPDTTWLPGGLFMGMSETQLRGHIKKNPKLFYADKKDPMNYVHTRIGEQDYSMDISLYNGKLKSIFYMGETTWKGVEDQGLRDQYNVVYNLIKGLNNYTFFEDTYKKKVGADWPYSVPFNDIVFMAEFNKKDAGYFLVSISSYEVKLSIDINFNGKTEGYESTLSKGVYFDR